MNPAVIRNWIDSCGRPNLWRSGRRRDLITRDGPGPGSPVSGVLAARPLLSLRVNDRGARRTLREHPGPALGRPVLDQQAPGGDGCVTAGTTSQDRRRRPGPRCLAHAPTIDRHAIVTNRIPAVPPGGRYRLLPRSPLPDRAIRVAVWAIFREFIERKRNRYDELVNIKLAHRDCTRCSHETFLWPARACHADGGDDPRVPRPWNCCRRAVRRPNRPASADRRWHAGTLADLVSVLRRGVRLERVVPGPVVGVRHAPSP